MFVHLLTCIRAIKGTLIRFLFQAAFEIKINRHLYVHRISFVLVSIGCRVHWPHTLPRLTSEGLSPKLILNHSRQKHMTDSICVLADSCLIVKHWLHCTAPINPVGMWKQREREKKKFLKLLISVGAAALYCTLITEAAKPSDHPYIFWSFCSLCMFPLSTLNVTNPFFP